MARNRRRHQRVGARGLAAHLRTERGRTPCVVENISIGGMFVRTDRLEGVGSEIFVDLVRPGWKRALTLTARITSRVDALSGHVSQQPPGLGLQFLRVEDQQHQRLRALLRDLGVAEPEATLPAESTEKELRSTELDKVHESVEPLDPQPQPLWQQGQTVEAAIEGSLRDAQLPPPGPVALEDKRSPPKAQQPAAPSRDARAPASDAPAADPQEGARLRFQIRGLILELSEVQQQLSQRDGEIQRLKTELEIIRSALARVVRNGS